MVKGRRVFPMFEFTSEDKRIGTMDWVDPGGNETHLNIPMYDDLAGVSINVDGQCDTDAEAVVKQPYNPWPIVDRLWIIGDGHQKMVDVRGEMLRFIHRVFFDTEPNFVETPDDTGQSNQDFGFECVIPAPIFKDSFKYVQLWVEWGTEADLDSEGGFNIDSASLVVTAHYGRIERELRLLTYRETATEAQVRIPTLGVLQSIILLNEAGVDTDLDNIELTHEGSELIDEEWMNLKAKTGVNDEQAPVDGYNSLMFNAIQPLNNTFLDLEADAEKSWQVLWVFASSIAPDGPRQGPLEPVPRLPLNFPDAISRNFNPRLVADLRLGTNYYPYNPFAGQFLGLGRGFTRV